jgi:hypothetical protein
MLKKAQYWKEFTAATRAEAEKAAATWWGEQSGFDKISGWILPASDPSGGADPRWTVTIIYKSSDPEPQPAMVH